MRLTRLFFFPMSRPPPRSTLFPYTTLFRSLRVKTPSLETKVMTLSGGNQQKVVIGKWLLADPKVLILDEPTRGVDVGAKVEIYELINRMTAQGRAVLLVSSDLPEVIGMSDRVVVMAPGRVAGELPKGATQDQVMALAVQEISA